MRTETVLLAGGFLWFATASITGCGSGTSSRSCPVGSVRPCTCPDGSSSTQECNPETLLWRPCECEGAAGNGGAPDGAAGAESTVGGAAEGGAGGAGPQDDTAGSAGGDVTSGGAGGSTGCNANQYECASGQCIPLFGLCDGVQVDCDDGSDEHPAVCGTGGDAGSPGSGGDTGSGGSVLGEGGTGGGGGSTGAGGSQPSLGGTSGAGGSPFGVGGNPFGLGGSPFGVGGDPFGVGGSPFGVAGNPFGLGGTPFGVGGSPFGGGGDPFGVGGTPFGRGGDPFGVAGSPFGVGGDAGTGGTGGAEGLNAEADYVMAQPSTLEATVILRNGSLDEIAMSAITIRYWLSLDGIDASQYTFECLYVALSAGSCDDVSWQLVPFETGDPTADAYIEISFPSASGALYPSDGGIVTFYVHLDDWSDFDGTNDYSYSASDYEPWETLTLYLDGELVWGTPPG